MSYQVIPSWGCLSKTIMCIKCNTSLASLPIKSHFDTSITSFSLSPPHDRLCLDEIPQKRQPASLFQGPDAPFIMTSAQRRLSVWLSWSNRHQLQYLASYCGASLFFWGPRRYRLYQVQCDNERIEEQKSILILPQSRVMRLSQTTLLRRAMKTPTLVFRYV